MQCTDKVQHGSGGHTPDDCAEQAGKMADEEWALAISDNSAVEIPDFATLLAPFIGAVPEAALPAFLARLERTAAERYRMWAEAVPDHAAGLLECAGREDEIATRVDKLFPATSPEHIAAMDAAIEPARDAYYAIFAELSPWEQMTIQANAERQGAAAWRAMIADAASADIKAELEQCAQLEEASADYLDALLQAQS